MNELTILIERWSQEKGLDNADSDKQTIKLFEEAGELAEGMNKNSPEQIIDSVGDIYVVLTILCQQLGINIEECVEAAYKEIKERTGEMRNGVFIKADDL